MPLQWIMKAFLMLLGHKNRWDTPFIKYLARFLIFLPLYSKKLSSLYLKFQSNIFLVIADALQMLWERRYSYKDHGNV